LPPGGAEVDIAVLFADVRGSTSLAEHISPTEFAAHMNRFYETATRVLLAHDAVIDKMVGDEVMALFIPGYGGRAYRRRAAEAARALILALGYGPGSQPWLPVGIAVHCGTAFVGNVGGTGVTDFTALGDTVNTAARLQARAGPGEVVFTPELYKLIESEHPAVAPETVTVRGKEEPFDVYVLRGADLA
jgi:adenylate cyclase